MARQARLNYSFAPQRIERLKATQEFRDIATSTKKEKDREEELRYGRSIQEQIVLLLSDMDERRVYHDRDEFRQKLESLFRGFVRFPDYFWDVLMEALSEKEKRDWGESPPKVRKFQSPDESWLWRSRIVGLYATHNDRLNRRRLPPLVDPPVMMPIIPSG
jgi:hypothetical protein